MLAILAAVFAGLPLRSFAQNPVPLPTDGNLAAYITVSGNFQSGTLPDQRNLTMRTWAAAFGPGQQFDFSALDSRAFLTLDLSTDQGWGYFLALDQNLTIAVNITDSQNRLGSIKIYEVDSGTLVSTVQANAGHNQAQTTFQRDAEIRNYRIDILDTNGTSLSQLAVDNGKWDQVYPITIAGGFEPYYPAPISSAHYTPNGNDFHGTQGDPKLAPGVLSSTSMGTSSSAAALDYSNDNSVTFSLMPPFDFRQFVKRDVISNSLILSRFKVGEPAALAALQNAITSASVRDPTTALGNIDILPYDDATGLWHADFRGAATAFLAVPFERKRRTNGVGVLVQAIVAGISARHDFLSNLAAAAGNSWLADIANQQSSGFNQGDVQAWGDIYGLIVSEGSKSAIRNDPILQTVTFTLQPDIVPDSGAGTGTIQVVSASTTPAPPPPTFDPQLLFSSPNWSVTRQVSKGYKYKATGTVSSPAGYAAGTSAEYFIPGASTIVIPTTLTVLLELKVEVTGFNWPTGANVQLIQNNNVVYSASTVETPDHHFIATFHTINPGTYTIKAINMYYNDGTATYTVEKGKTASTTVAIGSRKF